MSTAKKVAKSGFSTPRSASRSLPPLTDSPRLSRGQGGQLPELTDATHPGAVYEVQVSRSRKAFMREGKARKNLPAACDAYRAVLRNAKPGTKIRLRNTLTGQTLASHEVTK